MSFDFGSIINGINQATQVVGAVNGAVNVMAPALQNVNMAVNQVAGNVNGLIGYRQDAYAQPPMGYYPPNGMPAAMPMPQGVPDESSVMGTVGNAIAGGGIGAIMGKNLSLNLKPQLPTSPTVPTTPGSATTEALPSLSPNAKSMMMTGLKAGGIGAAVGGVFSGIENMTKLSRSEITGAEATGNIVADTTVGFFSGMGGLAGGTLGSMAVRAMTSGSIPLAIGGAVAGAIGSTAIDMLLRKTGVRQTIADGVRSMVAG